MLQILTEARRDIHYSEPEILARAGQCMTANAVGTVQALLNYTQKAWFHTNGNSLLADFLLVVTGFVHILAMLFSPRD